MTDQTIISANGNAWLLDSQRDGMAWLLPIIDGVAWFTGAVVMPVAEVERQVAEAGATVRRLGDD